MVECEECEEVAMVKSCCHDVGLRVLRYWEGYLLSLVAQKWLSGQTRQEGEILLPFDRSCPCPFACPSSQT